MPRYLSFDLETTGLDLAEDRIVEIGGVMDGAPRNLRLNPGILIPEGSSEVHGIYYDHIRDAPTFPDVYPHLAKDFKAADILLGYNVARFDIPLLNTECRRYDLPELVPPDKPVIDLLTFMQWNYPHLKNRLVDVAPRYGVSLQYAHCAGADAEAVMSLWAAVPRKSLEWYQEKTTLLAEHREKYGYHVYFDKASGLCRYGYGKHKGRLVKDFPGYARQCTLAKHSPTLAAEEAIRNAIA